MMVGITPRLVLGIGVTMLIKALVSTCMPDRLMVDVVKPTGGKRKEE